MACPDNIIEAFIAEIKFFISLANNNTHIMNQETMLDHCSKTINEKIALLNNHCLKAIEQESFFHHHQYYLETRYPTPFAMDDDDSSNEGLLGISADSDFSVLFQIHS
jgi:hypothetical protein